MSLRLKVVFILTFACALGDAMFIAFWQPWYLSQAIKRERLALQGHLVTLSDAVTPFLLQNQIAAVYEIFDATLDRQPEWRSLILHDADDAVLYPLAPTPFSATDNVERMSYTIALRNSRLGRIELVADLSNQIRSLKKTMWLTLGFITLGVALVGLLIGLTLEVVVGRRARQLVEAAERIGQGDFSTVILESNPDEIGRVAQALNSMRESIAANDRLLIQARMAAEKSDRAKSAFLATMSHEIRTPMNGILGMAQMLLESNLSDGERRDYARTILNSGQTLLALLNDILDISKIESGRFELESSVCEPGRILHETKALFADAAGQKGLRIEASWSGPTQRYRSDPHRLRQMLANLVGNAIKFTASGHIQVDGREIERDGSMSTLEFSVLDTGIGIPEDKLPLLFQPFSQVDSSITRQFGGTGLGLSIVRSLARLLGGDVGVESTPGRGSRFWFRIEAEPVTEETDCRDEVRPIPEVAGQGATSTQISGRILLVEDNPTNRKVAEIMLKKLGLTAMSAADGREGLDIVTGGNLPDLILMDVNMPVMDGYTATARIRRWETESGRPRLPIIALTADAYEEDRQHCLEVGMDDFLTKPITLGTLKSMLGKWLPDSAPLSPIATAPAKKQVDIPHVKALLDALVPLLEQNRFDAMERFNELQEALSDTEFAGTIAEMKPQLDALNFDFVLARLNQLSETQPWNEARS